MVLETPSIQAIYILSKINLEERPRTEESARLRKVLQGVGLKLVITMTIRIQEGDGCFYNEEPV